MPGGKRGRRPPPNPRGVNQYTKRRDDAAHAPQQAPGPTPARASSPARAGGHLERFDGWQSALTGLGMPGRDKRTASGFGVVEDVGWDMAADLWRGDDIAARVIEKIPAEEMRQGFEIQINGHDHSKELSERITGVLEDVGLGPAIEEARCYERAYGGGAVLLGANDGGALSEPLDPRRVQSLDWVTVLEPRELVPRYYYANPQAPKFGQPAIYTLQPLSQGLAADGDLGAAAAPRDIEVHESRLLVFGGIRVSRRRLATMNLGWGDSILTRVYRVLLDFGMTWSAAAVLVQEFAQPIFKLKGLAELIAGDKDSVVQGRMQALAYSRSVVNTLLIDAEEEFKREQTPVTGLPELLDKFSVRLAAAADMPLTLLMGQSPAGLNATGESDIRFFYDRVRAGQERRLRPAIERVCKILFRSIGAEPESWSVRFPPLWQPSDKEQADTRFVQAQTDAVYLQNGVVSPEEIALSRFSTDEFSYATQIDFAVREQLEAPAQVAIGGDPETPPPGKLPAAGADEVDAEIVDRAGAGRVRT